MRCCVSSPVSGRVGSTMARLPCTHFGSRRLSHGLLLGNWHSSRRQPPERLTRWLWALSHVRTARLVCQEALSQITTSACLPSLANLSASHPRYWVVT